MGIICSKRSRAHDHDEELLAMHRHVFSRAMRKQDKRLEKDAKALEKAGKGVNLVAGDQQMQPMQPM